MDVIQPSLSAALVVVIFVLVDRVIVPLVKGKSNNGRHKDSGRDDDRNQQQLVNEITARRMDKLENQLSENRAAVGDVGTAIEVIKAIVERIEARLK